MSEITPIESIKNRPNPNVVLALEGLLELAKEGKIKAFAAVAFNSDETWTETRVGQYYLLTLLGALESLKFSILVNDIDHA